MLIEAGYDIAFECPAQTPMLLQLNAARLYEGMQKAGVPEG
jgi:hypothetical protein